MSCTRTQLTASGVGLEPPTFQLLDNPLFHLGQSHPSCCSLTFPTIQNSILSTGTGRRNSPLTDRATLGQGIQNGKDNRYTHTYTHLHSECKRTKYFQKARDKYGHIASFSHTPLSLTALESRPKHIRFPVGTQHKHTRLTHMCRRGRRRRCLTDS